MPPYYATTNNISWDKPPKLLGEITELLWHLSHSYTVKTCPDVHIHDDNGNSNDNNVVHFSELISTKKPVDSL